MKTNRNKAKIRMALAAVIIGSLLSLMTYFFVSAVQEQLWQQSINTMMESTQQGLNTLQVQLQEEYETLGNLALSLKELPTGQSRELENILQNYAKVDSGVSLFLSNSSHFPAGTKMDQTAVDALRNSNEAHGIVNPHISSATGVNVFTLYVRLTFQDGTSGFLMKEYEVGSIVDSFSLSFYDNAGFSYVVDASGDVLIRPPHPGSNKTVQNLFDILRESPNNQNRLQEFTEALAKNQMGWATFSYQGESTVFCYTPLQLQTDWYLVSIVPQSVVNAQTNQIILRTLALIGAIILGIALLVAVYFRYINRTNRKLRSQTDYTAHLYNAVPEGIALMTVEQPCRLLQLNREGLRLLDYPENSPNDAPKGRSIQEVIHEDDFGETEQIFLNTAQTGEKHSFENRVLKADGGYFWAAGIVEKTLDDNGNAILIATFHDITSEKMAQEEEKREKQQERLLLVGAISNVYPVIISLNLSKDTLNFIYVRQGLMVHMGEQTSYSALFSDFNSTVHPDNREEFKRRFAPDSLRAALGRTKGEVYLEARQILLDNAYHWTSIQIIHVDNPYSDDQLAILISRRIDEQRHEEQQQRQALESALENAKAASLAKSQFLSNMSHDIRTPMNAIVGMTAIAATHLNDTERVAECLKKISLSSKHLLSLINDVLDMSKIESGKLSMREEPFNFAQLVADCAELVRQQADAKQLTMDIQMPLLKNENVLGDPLRVRQIFINVLSNAVKYTPAGGTVWVEVRQEPAIRREFQNYVFRCSDTGIGMSAEFMKKLFQPFERAQDSTANKMSGTGLGMAITKNLVDMMSGDIQVNSTKGQGSVFTVTLPLQLQNAPPEEIPQEFAGVHTLIVDDDLQTCENTAELLDDMGLRAEFVTKGETAVQFVVQAKDTQDPFQLVIVDWKMPDIDGLEVARRIRAKIGPDIPVIVLTAYDWSEIEGEAHEAGVTSFLSKPFYRSKICYLLQELSGQKQPVLHSVPVQKPDYHGKRILLVEDNLMNREIARTLMEEMGVMVEEACDGLQAVEKLQKSPNGYYHLIFMDVQMPNMNGYEATRAIRALEREDAKTVPIIAMTANAFEEDVRNALQAGMNAHFAKPIDVLELEKLLYRYLMDKERQGG